MRKIFILFFLFFLISLSLCKEKKESQKYKIVTVKAKYFKYNNKTKELFTDKGIVLNTEDIEISAEEILYNTETEIAKLKGNLKFTQTGSEITGDYAVVNLKEKNILFENNIKMIQEKKEIKKDSSFKEHLKEKIFLFCDKIEYNYDKKEGIATGNIKVEQEDAVAKGNKAIYIDKEQLLTVEGDVLLEKKDGDRLYCKKAIISLKDDTLEVEGNVEGKFKIEEEKVPDTKF